MHETRSQATINSDCVPHPTEGKPFRRERSNEVSPRSGHAGGVAVNPRGIAIPFIADNVLESPGSEAAYFLPDLTRSNRPTFWLRGSTS